jgi:Glyoxalase/Bleomycin resistance protein/Dioxygenase superfamily
VVTILLIVKDVARTRRFYEQVFGAQRIEDDDPAVLRLDNTWLLINSGDAPTDDKPTVTVASPADPDRLPVYDSAMNHFLFYISLIAVISASASSAADLSGSPDMENMMGSYRCLSHDPNGRISYFMPTCPRPVYKVIAF